MTTDTAPSTFVSPAKFAVAILVLRQNSEVEGRWECILVARKDDHTKWSLPGGKVDPGETSLYAAAREFAEETGISVGYREEFPVQLRFIPQGTVLDSGGYFTTCYLLDTTGLELPETFEVEGHEAPVEWGPVHRLLSGPFGSENAKRLQRIGVWS